MDDLTNVCHKCFGDVGSKSDGSAGFITHPPPRFEQIEMLVPVESEQNYIYEWMKAAGQTAETSI